ncbi:DUF4221 family protein [Chitinophaga filiformis]|uniref:DUF4221 domain-containing protein n=1 Tax=Chitinophaga filiformis TaxID=104663 RepID=A0A1G8A8N5_CHIFI|nr:DUF4221 family protein [Chitinophaga filiformis]SDH17355.1 protein of unknown function [Chitinophaga filiformis]
MSGRSFFLFLGALISLYACGGKTETPWSNCNTAGTIIPLTISTNDTLRLYLDSLMVMGISTPIDYHAAENVLYAFDSYNKRLLRYPLGKEGQVYPDSIHLVNIRQKISYMRYLSADSLVLYTYGSAKLFYYSMSRDTVYKSLDFVNREAPRMKSNAAAWPYANPASPVFFLGNRIIGTGFLLGEKEDELVNSRTICTMIDLSTGGISQRLSYSKVYWQHNWGGSHLRTPYCAYNEQTKHLIISLPADHNIQVIDSNWQTKELYAGSRSNICITSMSLSKNDKQILDPKLALAYYTSTPSYRNIIYDQYHDRYYRLLELPPADEVSITAKLRGKQTSLIAFDKDFKYLGEAALPDALALDNFFVTREGIYFLNANNKDQNIAQYVQCKIEL